MLLADSFRYSYSTTDLPWHFITALRREPKWFLIVTREIGIIVNNGALKWAMNVTFPQVWQNSTMSKNEDTKGMAPGARKSESGQSLESAGNANPGMEEVEVVQPKQGVWRTYDVADGLPGGLARLMQDRHGYLWLIARWDAKPNLCRYDGVEFTTYTPDEGLPDSNVRFIHEDSQGRLWVALWDIGISCFDGFSSSSSRRFGRVSGTG